MDPHTFEKKKNHCHFVLLDNDESTLAVDGWAVTFGTARRGLGRATARSVPSTLYQM